MTEDDLKRIAQEVAKERGIYAIDLRWDATNVAIMQRVAAEAVSQARAVAQ